MLIRITGLIILADLYAYMHEINDVFPATVLACTALGVIDIVIERMFK